MLAPLPQARRGLTGRGRQLNSHERVKNNRDREKERKKEIHRETERERERESEKESKR